MTLDTPKPGDSMSFDLVLCVVTKVNTKKGTVTIERVDDDEHEREIPMALAQVAIHQRKLELAAIGKLDDSIGNYRKRSKSSGKSAAKKEPDPLPELLEREMIVLLCTEEHKDGLDGEGRLPSQGIVRIKRDFRGLIEHAEENLAAGSGFRRWLVAELEEAMTPNFF